MHRNRPQPVRCGDCGLAIARPSRPAAPAPRRVSNLRPFRAASVQRAVGEADRLPRSGNGPPGGPHKRHVLTANAVGNAAKLRPATRRPEGLPRSGNPEAEDRRIGGLASWRVEVFPPAWRKRGESSPPSSTAVWQKIPSPGTRPGKDHRDLTGKNFCSFLPPPGSCGAGQN